MNKVIYIVLSVFGVYVLIHFLPVLYWQLLLIGGRSELDITSDRVIGKTGKQLREKYGLYPVCFGGSSTDAGVTSFALELQRYGPPFDLDESRELILECAEIFHKTINEDEHVRKFLIRYPFSMNDISIGVYHYGPDRYLHTHPSIGIIHCTRGCVEYCTETLEDRKRYKYTTQCSEPYEEAVAIVKKQRMERQAALGMSCPVDESRLNDS